MENSIEKLTEMYGDSKLSPKEIIEFRKLSERTVVNILQLDGDQGTTNALCKSFEVTNQLLQMTIIKARKDKDNLTYKSLLSDVIFAQMELLKANIVLFDFQ